MDKNIRNMVSILESGYSDAIIPIDIEKEAQELMDKYIDVPKFIETQANKKW